MALTPTEKAAAQKILNSLPGHAGWTIQGSRDEVKPTVYINDDGDQVKEDRPTGNVVLVIVGPSGQPDEMTVKPTAAVAGAPAGSSDADAAYSAANPSTPAGFEIVAGPSQSIAKNGAGDPQGQTQANDPKDHRTTKLVDMPDGSKASVEFIADGYGNASPDTSKPPVPYIAAAGKPPPEPALSTTMQSLPVFKDGAWSWEPNRNYVPPKPDKPELTPDEKLTTGGRAADTAIAATAAPTADANLSRLQAETAKAQIELKRAEQDLINQPTSAEAQRAKDTAQRTLELAQQAQQQALDQSSAEAPGRLAQQGATLDQSRAATEASRATVDKAKQGALYGAQDRIKQIRDLIASGEVKPQDADNMIAAEMRGTDIYSVMKQQAEEKSAARGQDVSNKNQLAGTFGSAFNNSLNTFGEMNKTGAVGSDATGKAFLATLGLAQDYLKSYEMPAATPTDYLGTGSPVGGMVNQAQQQLAVPPPVPVAPPPAPAGAPPVVINIGGGGSGQPLLPPGVAGTGADPRFGGQTPPAMGTQGGYQGAPNPNTFGSGGGDMLASAAAQGTMASKGEVLQTLFPRHAKALGLM